MSTETEAEGEILMKFLAALGGALGAVATDPVANAVPPEVGDTLDKSVRGFGNAKRGGAYAVLQALAVRDLRTARRVDTAHLMQMSEIIEEVMRDHRNFGDALENWWSDCMSRWRVELQQEHHGEPEHMVAEEVGR